MNHWFTSDTHWGHKNIIEYSKRPFSSVEEMNEKLIENWNAVVKKDDIVYHLGDFAFMSYADTKSVITRLSGKQIHLIKGNHDEKIFQNRVELTTVPSYFSSIQDYAEINVSGQMIVLFHYGQRVWHKSHRGSYMLYGHSHGSLPPHGLSVDVGVDCKEIHSEYRPTSFEEIRAYMRTRVPEKVDHHGDKRADGST